MNDTQPPPGASAPLVTKDAIIDIAMEVIKENGYAGYSPDTERLGMMVTAMGKLQRLDETDRAATTAALQAAREELATVLLEAMQRGVNLDYPVNDKAFDERYKQLTGRSFFDE